ncbi:NAD(P)H-binding protein [Algivirga pacifica]|uniref:SDR family oxidoreductase n=1 Tax=Algivirga pacifica TaxID=1162670 RepID=A0ABP9DD01_9BACT
MKNISILGCGWLGFPLAKQLASTGYNIKGSTTTEQKLSVLKESNISPYLISLSPEDKEEKVLEEFLEDTDTLVICIPPRYRTFKDVERPAQQMQQLITVAREKGVKHILSCSSTAVYPSHNQLATEESPLLDNDHARMLLKAEDALTSSGIPTTIIRFGGLMGGQRILCKYLQHKEGLDDGKTPVNYIHQEDAVNVLWTVIQQDIWGEIFNASAPEHPTRKELCQIQSEQYDFQMPKFAQEPTQTPYKVIDSSKLIENLPYTFIYADPRDFPYDL